MLIVELEGGIYDCADQKEYDFARFEELDARGFRILRINNSEVMENIDKVLEIILKFR